MRKSSALSSRLVVEDDVSFPVRLYDVTCVLKADCLISVLRSVGLRRRAPLQFVVVDLYRA